MNNPELNHRIPVTEATRDRLRDFSFGAGVTYDEAVNFLLDAYGKGRDDLTAGREDREAIQAHVGGKA